MGWIRTIGIFLKGLFQTLNNPARLEIKEKKLADKAEVIKQKNRKKAERQERKADRQERKTDRKK